MPDTRLFADRRTGTDRRAAPRRHFVAGALPLPERRRVVDRRRGAERRSTLDRRGRVRANRGGESPGEHVRNALQLLAAFQAVAGSDAEESADLTAAVERLRRALTLLERRRG